MWSALNSAATARYTQISFRSFHANSSPPCACDRRFRACLPGGAAQQREQDDDLRPCATHTRAASREVHTAKSMRALLLVLLHPLALIVWLHVGM